MYKEAMLYIVCPSCRSWGLRRPVAHCDLDLPFEYRRNCSKMPQKLASSFFETRVSTWNNINWSAVWLLPPVADYTWQLQPDTC